MKIHGTIPLMHMKTHALKTTDGLVVLCWFVLVALPKEVSGEVEGVEDVEGIEEATGIVIVLDCCLKQKERPF